jgi:hypothetical protein
VIGRGVLFLAWVLLGGVFTYGALYAFSPYGLVILTAASLLAWSLFNWTGRRSLELWGLLAGPGLLCFLVAEHADEPAAWVAVGVVFVAVATVAYVLAGRARCARTA